jgi:thiol-disulfide isomerase/thioredoxin
MSPERAAGIGDTLTGPDDVLSGMATAENSPQGLDSKANLDQVVAANSRVLVEFYTQGCGVCASMEPVLGTVAKATDVPVVTMNPRDDPVLVEEYDVRSVPKLLLFEDGGVAKTLENGFVPVDDVLAFVGAS